MNASTEPKAIQEIAKKMISLLGLSASPVGVKLASPGTAETYPAERLRQHRYCQAFMKARHGGAVSLDAEGIACPAAAAAFGFKPLPENLRTGRGLVGFGIVSDASVGEKMFENMPRLSPGVVGNLLLMPLDACTFLPDVIVVEDDVEKLMWIVLSYLHATGGKRVPATTAVLQAACVDSTLIPYLEDRLNYGFSCYGCRDATDIRPGEALVGFPGNRLQVIGAHLEYLAEKAIQASRSKRALASLQRDESGDS
jgi:uncharacterized protein (DUF169 family)